MPTGYTNIVDDGATFGQYVWRCARAFGALVMMRDEPLDAPVALTVEPDAYYAEAVGRARAECAQLEAMSDAAADAAARADFDQKVRDHAEQVERSTRELERHRCMRAWVEAWEPPGKGHEKLKAFMLEQLEIGKPWELSNDSPQLLDGPTWRARKLIEARRSLAYAEERKANQERLCAERTRWIQELNASVPYEPQPKGAF